MFDHLPQSLIDDALAAIDPVKTLAIHKFVDDRTFRELFNEEFRYVYRHDLLYKMSNDLGLGDDDARALVDLQRLGRAIVGLKAAKDRGIKISASVARRVRAEMRTIRAEIDLQGAGKLLRMPR